MRLLPLFFSYIFRDTIRSKALLMLVLTVLAAASMAVLITLGVLEGFRTMLVDGERGWLGDVVISPRSGDVSIRPSEEITRRLVNMPAVEAFSVRSQAQTIVRFEEKKSTPFRTLGIDPADDTRVSWLGDKLIEGEFFSSSPASDEVVLGKGLADDLVGIEDDGRSVHVGDIVHVLSDNGEFRSVRVRGIIDAKNFSPNSILFFKKDSLEQMSGSNRDTQIIIRLRPGVDPIAARETLQSRFPTVVVRTWEEESQYVQDIMRAVKFVMLSIRDLLLVTIFFVVSIIIFIDISQKRRQIGILKSMGTPNTFIAGAYITQALLYALVGFAFGSTIFFFVGMWSSNHPIPLLIGDFRILANSEIFIQAVTTVALSAVIGAVAPIWIALSSTIVEDMHNMR